VVDDPQDLDEAEGGPKPAQGRLLVGVELDHGPSRLPSRGLVASGAQVQVDPAALELEFVDLALAVVFIASLEGEHLKVAGEALELDRQVSYRHLRSVACQALYVVLSQGSGVVAIRPFRAVMTRLLEQAWTSGIVRFSLPYADRNWLLARERSRQPEPWEHGVLEAGHGADPVAGEGEDVQADPVAEAGRGA
jgi:hypothetical protein